MRVNDLVRFIKEREKIRVKKESGKKRPWTSDDILGKFRFCNVHREDDRVTRWLRANWYKHFEGDADVWFAAVVARLFNQPDALYEIMPYVLPWKPEKVRAILHKRRDAGLKNFNAAYIVSTNGVAMDKVDYIVARVFGPLWANRKKMRPLDDDLNPLTLAGYHQELMGYDGLGSFIAAQVIADLKYIKACPLGQADDWRDFAAPGPGSKRGLNRVMEIPIDHNQNSTWYHNLIVLRDKVNTKLDWNDPLDAQDLQNCLCEFDKYERARLGEGTPKQIYKERVND